MSLANLPLRLAPLSRKCVDLADLDRDLLPDLDLSKSADPKERFKVFAMRYYDDLFEEMEFRCLRASMMHYHEANRYSSKCYYMELAAALLGAASVSGIGAFLLKWSWGEGEGLLSLPSSAPRSAGVLAVLGVVLASLLEFGSKSSSSLFPTMCQRCNGHKKAAVGWRKLSRLTRSYRIQLRNPSLSVDDFMAWHTQLVQQRHKVSAIALVPSATFRAFNDPARVFNALRRRRDIFLSFQQMTEGKGDFSKLPDYDDD